MNGPQLKHQPGVTRARAKRGYVPHLAALFGAVLSIKMVLLVLDPQVKLFLGDSIAFIKQVLFDFALPDRSYYYARFIALLTGLSGSLVSVVIAQVIVSSLSCILIAVSLLRHFEASFRVAATVCLLFSVEPLQLFYERSLMTETLSTFFFSCLIFSLLQFLHARRFRWLVFAVMFGLVAVKFRTALAPAYLFALAFTAITFAYSILKIRANSGENRNPALLHISFACFLIAALVPLTFLSANALQAKLGKLPGYSNGGLYVISAWSPLLAQHNPPFGPDIDELMQDSPCSNFAFERRNTQRWNRDCLVGRLVAHFGSNRKASEYARSASLYLLRTDPFGIVALGWKTYLDYWDRDAVQHKLEVHRGTNKDFRQEDRDTLLKEFGLVVPERYDGTDLVGSYFAAAKGWYFVLAAFPFAVIALPLLRTPHRRYLLFLGSVFVLHFSVVLLLASEISIRYLHPLAWLFALIVGGVIVDVAGFRSASSATRSRPDRKAD